LIFSASSSAPPRLGGEKNMPQSYVELHARSAFSFLEGGCVPEELAGACSELQMPAMALVDRNGVYGAQGWFVDGNYD
jgi:error-prone DNA polymerase